MPVSSSPIPDLASIAGQDHAKRALEVAACGGHSIALTGAPGNGKSLLARALIGLIPPQAEGVPRPVLAEEEALAWVQEALRGQTGSLDYAEHGMLLLERLDCFVYSSLQIQRVGVVLDRIADVQVILTRQPCPCGFWSDPLRVCSCSAHWIERHHRRLQALVERMHLEVEIPRLERSPQQEKRQGETSTSVSQRVCEGAERQRARFAALGLPLTRNAQMDHPLVLRCCVLEGETQKLYQAAHRQLHLSARAAENVLMVARTVADLGGSERIQSVHLAEAIQYLPRIHRDS